ncbi:MAG TPA: DNA mismatch repair protein MutS, partial [Rhodothermales bacterium]
ETGPSGLVAGFACIDVSTGEFGLAQVPERRLDELLHAFAPREVLVQKQHRTRLGQRTEFLVTLREDWCFTFDFAFETLIRHFNTHSLKGFGVDEEDRAAIVAAGAALHYLAETQQGQLPHIARLTPYAPEDFMALDPQTKRNLELVSTMQGGGSDGSLFSVLDETLTPMGGRLLRRWLLRPLKKVTEIRQRLDAVGEFVESRRLRERLRSELKEIGDLERLAARIAVGRASPRDLHHLRLSLQQVPAVKECLAPASSERLRTLGQDLSLMQPVVDLIARTLVDDPPASITDGGVIRDGVNAELDELRSIARDGKSWLARLQKEEAERSGIPSLKIGYNKVFGYYIEITNAHRNRVPDSYIRKQTLVNSERYITPALKEYEEKILTAEEKIGTLETSLFNELRMAVAEQTAAIQANAARLATVDCLAALGEVAERYRYVRPEVDDSRILEVVDGRHPVVEHVLPPGEPFIPNSVRLDPEREQILIITGPNMAGKSVVLRQTGLIVLLAQVGSFVPAASAHIGIVDRIFTRVGASDNLAAGESTFLVEMNETASILNNATEASLLLLDEVGRGTSTFDGLSIAWALVEYLHETPRIAARTLFATHYHELNELAHRFDRVRNYRVQVQEHGGRVIFLRKLLPGGADHSYGIEVARMAGLPEPVIRRARQILHHLESQELDVHDDRAEAARDAGDGAPTRRPAEPQELPPLDHRAFQMSLFDAPDPVLLKLKEELE